MSGDVSPRAEPVIAALGEDIRPAVQRLERIFHDYDIGDATDCVYCGASVPAEKEGERE